MIDSLSDIDLPTVLNTYIPGFLSHSVVLIWEMVSLDGTACTDNAKFVDLRDIRNRLSSSHDDMRLRCW